MKKIGLMAILIAGIALSACTDAKMKQITAIGSKAHVKCWSGGTVILDTWSTGKVATEEGSDGWYFEDQNTGKLIRTNADCVVEN
jgi:hypothetical protein